MSRWVRIDADIFDNPIFKPEPFGFYEAYIWLTQIWDPEKMGPERVLKRFKWFPKRLRTFLKLTEEQFGACPPVFAPLEQFCRSTTPRPSIPKHVKDAVVKRDGYVCRYCRTTEGPWHLDHIKPWSRGGSHSVANLTIACAPCNLTKRDKTLKELGWTS